jgi:transposase
MPQSRTRSSGLDVHTEAMAVAYVAQHHGADGVFLGSMGPRPCDMDTRLRRRPSTRTPLVVVAEAGPCGSGRSRDLRTQGYLCGVGAPALLPPQAGDRVQTDGRDAVPRARLRRSGALTPLDVPSVEDDASRDLIRARAEVLRALNAAKVRLNAFWLRHDLRSTSWATWGLAHLRWRSEGSCATSAPHIVFQAYVWAVNAPTARLTRLEPSAPSADEYLAGGPGG